MLRWVDDHHIYALSDPRTGAVHYVGQTVDLRCRLRRHVMDAPGSTYPVGEWIRSLLEADVLPELTVLEVTDADGWDLAERFWIAYYRSIGAPLTNVSPGGKLSGGYWAAHERAHQLVHRAALEG